MRTWALRLLIVPCILVGLWDTRLALPAVFVFRNEEPLASWLAIALGPGLTLLASSSQSQSPNGVASCSIFAATIAFAIFTIAGGDPDAVAEYFQMFTLPSILLGAGFLILNQHRATPTPHAP